MPIGPYAESGKTPFTESDEEDIGDAEQRSETVHRAIGTREKRVVLLAFVYADFPLCTRISWTPGRVGPAAGKREEWS
ncbi:oligopeptidase A [Streptomyces sp. NBRC 110611]|nr:oligopeptidase A [Streptomyces sp. NBRC 110611]